MPKIGIPRSLLFYDYYPLWQTFFESLGAEVIISKETNKKMLNEGSLATLDEVCLPMKVFNGHIASIKDDVDYLFIPRIMSLYKNQFICPKFLGLPELVKSSFKELPEIISPIINYSKGRNNIKKIVFETGSYFTTSSALLKKAYINALQSYGEYREIKEMGNLPIDVIEKITKLKNNDESKPKILLLGHPYVIYDKFINMNIISKLREYGYDVVTEDSFNIKKIKKVLDESKIEMYWTFGIKILGSAFYCMEKGNISGIIYISSFACGLDSVIAEILEKRIKREEKLPYAMLTIDEHTGEAGIDTRIEAFIDMLKRRELYENYVSTFG